jgi:hypothetical protein
MPSEILLAAAIAAIFIVPALTLPNVGRGMLAALFLGGGLFNLLNTLPGAPQSLLDLVAMAPVTPYREVIGYVVAWNAGPAFVLAIVAFEPVTGVLLLWRGNLARLAALLLARRHYGESLPTIARAYLHKPAAPHAASVR